MHIHTPPVYSKLADEATVQALGLAERLPAGWRLSQHQVDTYRALTQGETEVIFNTAMTGDGKSLAAQLPILMAQQGWQYPTLAMYPTNELIEDQTLHLETTLRHWRTDIQFGRLNGAQLDLAMQEDNYTKRGEALMRILHNGDFILSNPDIFHYVMHQFYTWPEDAPDRYAGQLAQKFLQLTFDEFHIFDAPQIISVLNALLFIHTISQSVRPHKFLFLSATPKALMQDYLQRSGLKVASIGGHYASQGGTGWRKILNPTTIHFEPVSRAEVWLETHLDDIVLPFFQQRRPHAKGAIIVTARAAATRIHEKLQPVFARHGLTVGINTGWTGRTRRQEAREADLLIGTSTVDVGVDFQINFLVFESDNAGNFLQRLGRLGRHEAYQRNGQTIPFQDFVAYALLPDWLVARLFESQNGAPPKLRQGAETERMALTQIVDDVFPSATEFEHYARTWGKYQTTKILWGMARKPVYEQYRETRLQLTKRYETTFGIHIKSVYGELKELENQQPALLNEALSFRGSTLFPCCVIDTDESGAEQFKVVDLVAAVTNHFLEYLRAEEFYAAVRQAKLEPTLFKKQEPLGFFWLRAPREFQPPVFSFNADMLGWGAENFGQAITRKGFALDADFPGQGEINRKLQGKDLPTLFCAGSNPFELKRRLNLPLLFPLYTFVSRDNISGTVAFGRAALLLDARLRFHPLNCGGGAIFA